MTMPLKPKPVQSKPSYLSWFKYIIPIGLIVGAITCYVSTEDRNTRFGWFGPALIILAAVAILVIVSTRKSDI